jgi:transposase
MRFADMLTALQHMDIHFLKRQGHSVRQIARLTGHARNTVRAILKAEGLRPPQTRSRPTKLDEHHDYLRERAATGLSAVRLFTELQTRGYHGGIHAVRRFLARIEARQRAAQLTVRFETGPGEQAQVDWKHAGVFTDPQGRTVKVYAFVMVLGFSRALYVQFTTSMALPLLLACHEAAFAFFGGVPRRILYDNMKQVRVGPGQLHPQLLDFAAHHGFTPSTHRAYRPRTKGKVERAIQYLDGSLLQGREFADVPALNAFARHWCEHTANARVHATTKEKPAVLLAKEQLAPARTAYPFLETRQVDAGSFVAWRGSRYSVPPVHVGRTVAVLGAHGRVQVRLGETIIAEHAQAAKSGQTLADPAHLAEVWKLSVPGGADRPPPPNWKLTFDAQVPVRPLAAYAEVSA